MTDPDFDIYDLPRSFLIDPFPTYHALRESDPVHRNSDGTYFITRYEDVTKLYRTKTTFSDKTEMYVKKFGEGPLLEQHTKSMLFSDPPAHTRIRKLVAHAFTPRAMKSLEGRVVELVDGLLDRAEKQGGMDLINDFAFALPVEVICTMLGIPPSEREPLQRWSNAILTPLEPVATPEMVERGNVAVAEFKTFLKDLLDDRRRNPADYGDDIMAELLEAEEDGDRLSETELIQNCIFMLNAGHETTTNLVGNGMDALLENPDQLKRLRDQPELIGSAVEEMLRFDSPLQIGNRGITEPITFGDVTLPAGTQIMTSIGGANRDPAQFPDPDRFDIARQPNRHVAFAAGIHACLGAPLARIEGTIAVGRLVSRFPDLRRAGEGVRGGRARFRGFTILPVTV
ncbi:cytochrome P450 [Minwuia sp.]|uniref:cytochrome P450 n=1 Tax=Minwuia sp. TaxID=2493630 RepID=UPI003A8EEAAB